MSDDHSRLARLEQDVKNICRTLDDMRQDAKMREEILQKIHEQTIKTNGRVSALEEHKNTVCKATIDGLDVVRRRMWILAGVMAGSGVAGAELINRIFG